MHQLPHSRLDGGSARPLFSILMPVYNTNPRFLDASIRSVTAQTYHNWQLCIADDASTDDSVLAVISKHKQQDPRIYFHQRRERGHISRASNSALEMATGEYLALLDHDDLLACDALQCAAAAIDDRPTVQILYTDEDKISEADILYEPYLKPDYDHELLMAQNMISHLGIYRRTSVIAVGGFRLGFDGSQDWDLALRVAEQCTREDIVHIPHILYHWRASIGSTAQAARNKSYAGTAGRKAVAEHLRRRGVSARVTSAPGLEQYNRVQYAVPLPSPKVSICMASTGSWCSIQAAVKRIKEKTRYSNYEILIVDRHRLFKPAPRLSGPLRFCAVPWASQPRLAVSFNATAARATGDFYCFMDDRTVPENSDWLAELVSSLYSPHSACVGPKILDKRKRIKSAGLLITCNGAIHEPNRNIKNTDAGYFGQALLRHETTALDHPGFTVRASLFQQLGGFNESLGDCFFAADLCLRFRQLGYSILWTPWSEVVNTRHRLQAGFSWSRLFAKAAARRRM